MKRVRGVAFEDVAPTLRDACILLDVDGTLLPDGGTQLMDQTIAAARDLATHNKVYLVSNGKDAGRVRRIADTLDIPIAPAGVPAGKPGKAAASGVEGALLVVMGDKYLIDGLFARNLGARFILVERKRSGEERFFVRLSYFLDRVVSWLL